MLSQDGHKSVVSIPALQTRSAAKDPTKSPRMRSESSAWLEAGPRRWDFGVTTRDLFQSNTVVVSKTLAASLAAVYLRK